MVLQWAPSSSEVAGLLEVGSLSKVLGGLTMPGFGPNLGVGYGMSTIVWLVGIIVVVVIWWRGRRSNYVSGTPVVLKRFYVNEDPSARVGIEITGRMSGIVSWVLTLLRLEPEFELVVTNSEATLRLGSLSGIQYTYVPLRKISASLCAYQRSILALGFAILLSVGFVVNLLSGFFESDRSQVGSDMGYAFGFLILAAVAALIFFLSKRIGIVFETGHPGGYGFVFKRSVIEGVSVDLPEALRAIAVINARILNAESGHTHGGSGSMPPSPITVPVTPTGGGPRPCPNCSAVNPIDLRFCENCGGALPA